MTFGVYSTQRGTVSVQVPLIGLIVGFQKCHSNSRLHAILYHSWRHRFTESVQAIWPKHHLNENMGPLIIKRTPFVDTCKLCAIDFVMKVAFYRSRNWWYFKVCITIHRVLFLYWTAQEQLTRRFILANWLSYMSTWLTSIRITRHRGTILPPIDSWIKTLKDHRQHSCLRLEQACSQIA